MQLGNTTAYKGDNPARLEHAISKQTNKQTNVLQNGNYPRARSLTTVKAAVVTTKGLLRG